MVLLFPNMLNKKKSTLPPYTYTSLSRTKTSIQPIRNKSIVHKMSLTLFGLTILFSTIFLSSQAQQILFPVIDNKNSAVVGLIQPLDYTKPELEKVQFQIDNDNLLKSENTKVKVAIIGGGAGGTSAAFFLKHFANLENASLDTSVTLFESSDYIGGRSTVCWPWSDNPYSSVQDLEEEPVELGASIFIKGNKNLWKAANEFKLTIIEHKGEDDGAFSVWNGEEVLYSQSTGGWGWNIVKMLWRYGRTPMKVSALVKTTVDSFNSLYTPAFVSQGPFTSLYSFANSTALLEPLAVTSQNYFTDNQITPLFTNEIISAASTVNYGTPSSKLHAVGALVSLAAEGALSIEGGNRKIFQEFLNRSEAEVKLGKEGTVDEIIKLDSIDGAKPQWVVKARNGRGSTFDAIIFAAPFHKTGITMINTVVASSIPVQKYVHLYVTFVITNAPSPSPLYFGLSASTKMSKSIFSTFDSTTSNSIPEFNSLNYLKVLSPEVGAKFGGKGTYHVVKLFSSKSLSEDLISRLFGGEEFIGKVFRKSWDAYPLLDPIQSFSNEKNDVIGEKLDGRNYELADIKVDESFYYVNGFERIISTMETETVSAFNVVGLLLKDFYGFVSPKSWAEW